MNKKLISAIIALSAVAACNQPDTKNSVKEDVLRRDLDTTISPADDFFAYANNGWMKNNPIPGDETSGGIGELVQKELHRTGIDSVLTRAHTLNQPGSVITTRFTNFIT